MFISNKNLFSKRKGNNPQVDKDWFLEVYKTPDPKGPLCIFISYWEKEKHLGEIIKNSFLEGSNEKWWEILSQNKILLNIKDKNHNLP